ncbi:MAG: molybdopterin oxidoreductase family protein [Treponema sp.]|nr:molybdopterin oxidoreductase family protein [Treponema sp.]
MKKVQTTCNYCSLSCNLDFHVEGNAIQKVMPTPDYPVNRNFACIKGLSLDKPAIVNHTNPLPRIRDEKGNYKNVSWDEGFKHTAAKINELIKTHGNEAFASISTGQLTLEEMALLGHVARNFLRADVDGNTRLCMATSVVAHKQCLGYDAPPYTLNDFELSDTIILIGANPVVAHPVVWDRINSNKNKKLIVLDPRKSETAQRADYWYGLKPKSDLTLLYTLANLLIEKGWVDQNYIDNYTEMFAEYKAHVAAFKMDAVESTTGISADRLLELAKLIHEGKRVSLWWTMGINQGYEGVRTAQAIMAIAVMTGNIGREGTGGNSLTGQCNAMGSRAFSHQAGLYGGGDFDNPKRREAVCAALGITDEQLINKPTAPYNVIIEKILAGTIKGLWILCTNPRHSWANNETFRQVMEKLDLFIVQDIYDDTDSSVDCDIFLPVVPGIKKEGTIINTERRLSAMRPVIDRGPDEKTDYQVLFGVGEALGMGSLLDNWKTPKDAFGLMKKCSKGMPCEITGVDYDGLVDSKGIQWPFREGETLASDERRLFENNKFYHPSGKFKFMFEAVKENPLKNSAEFPYTLNTGRGTIGQWHTQTRTREVAFVQDVSAKDAYVLINPELAGKYSLAENDLLEIKSINGQSAVFKARITPNVPPDQLFAPIHYIETNKLTPSLYDSYSKEPSYKTTPVNIKKEGVKA